jgi:hypothetical protein
MSRKDANRQCAPPPRLELHRFLVQQTGNSAKRSSNLIYMYIPAVPIRARVFAFRREDATDGLLAPPEQLRKLLQAFALHGTVIRDCPSCSLCPAVPAVNTHCFLR